MKKVNLLSNQKVEFWGVCPSDEEKVLRHVELCGRHCYLSHDRMGEESHKKFFEMLCKNGHVSVFGHTNLVWKIEIKDYDIVNYISYVYKLNYQESIKFIFMNFSLSFGNLRTYFRFRLLDNIIYVSGNVRAWIEYMNSAYGNCFCYLDLCKAFNKYYPFIWMCANKYLSDMFFYEDFLESDACLLKNICRENVVYITPVSEEEQLKSLMRYDIPQFTFFIITDRGISHEIVRHTTFTFSQESTRYVNYNNRGFEFMVGDELSKIANVAEYFEKCSDFYEKCGLSPQWSRNFLPHALKTQLTMTGRKSAFDHFIRIRSAIGAHPSIREIAQKIEKFFEEGYKK